MTVEQEARTHNDLTAAAVCLEEVAALDSPVGAEVESIRRRLLALAREAVRVA